MNIRIFSYLLAVASLALGTQAAFGKDISLNDLTPAARQVAQRGLSSGTLKKVESVDYQGHQIYALTFQAPDGSKKYLYLNSDGSYVPNLASTAVPSSAYPSAVRSAAPRAVPSTVPLNSQNLQLSQLPESVQRVVQTETKNGPVSRIIQLPNHSGTGVMYEVFFAKPDGKQKIIYLNPDGSYVQNNQSNPSQTTRSWSAFGNRSQALSNPTFVNFSQLPAAVQNSLRSEAGGSDIRNVEMGQLGGQTVYQANITKNGQPLQIRVNPNGAIVGTRAAQSAFGTAQP